MQIKEEDKNEVSDTPLTYSFQYNVTIQFLVFARLKLKLILKWRLHIVIEAFPWWFLHYYSNKTTSVKVVVSCALSYLFYSLLKCQQNEVDPWPTHRVFKIDIILQARE